VLLTGPDLGKSVEEVVRGSVIAVRAGVRSVMRMKQMKDYLSFSLSKGRCVFVFRGVVYPSMSMCGPHSCQRESIQARK
jgi:hypothetical protein